jgi:hypothetical protein
MALGAVASLLELGAPRLAAPCLVLLAFLSTSLMRRSRSIRAELAMTSAR